MLQFLFVTVLLNINSIFDWLLKTLARSANTAANVV